MKKSSNLFYSLFLAFAILTVSFKLGIYRILGEENQNRNYKCVIPGTQIEFEMVYIPGGEFYMGSPENEFGRQDDERPIHKVKIDPFYIGKTEVTWDEYEHYAFENLIVSDPKEIVSITRPSASYEPYDHGWGRGKMPAMGISWHSAKKYCEWLSLKTGDFYRLPTEAEWEYACRAGSSTAYSFGNDTKDIEEYVWFDKNSGGRTNKVGLKRPNAFGLYDMHGNVWEFCLDYYDPNYYKTLKDEITINPKAPENGKVPVIRGGSWNDPPSELRCANRKYVPSEWWERDPMLPRGIWWLVDGQYVGLRVVRPINP